MDYNVQFDGGIVEMFFCMKCDFTSTIFTGKISSLGGLSVVTVLNHVHINYGTYCPHNSLKLVLILADQIESLTISLRLHIHLYLYNITPLS